MREFYDEGTLRGNYGAKLNIKALVVYPFGSLEKLYGMVVIRKAISDYESDQLGYLDIDEITFLIGALGKIIDNSKEMSGQKCDYTEIYYVTRSGAKFGFFQEGIKQDAFIRVNALEIQSNFFPTTISQLTELREIAMKAKEKLISLGAKE